jgi:hypothetical protein
MQELPMTPEEMLDAVRENARDTVDLLSRARKVERERVRAPRRTI